MMAPTVRETRGRRIPRAIRGAVLPLALVAIAGALTGCHRRPSPEQPRLYGIQVAATTSAEIGGSGSETVRGELLAVSRDSLWLLTTTAPRSVASLPLDRAVVRPTEGGRLRPHFWATVGGFATGLGMMTACSSYEGDAGCLATIPVMLGVFHVVGLVARGAMLVDRSDPLDTAPANLRRFARFPAGLPPGFPR